MERKKRGLKKFEDGKVCESNKACIEEKLDEKRNSGEGIEENGGKKKNSILEAAEKYIGEKRKTRNEWFDEECASVINKKMKPENDCYIKRLEGSKKYTTSLEEKQIKSVEEKRKK